MTWEGELWRRGGVAGTTQKQKRFVEEYLVDLNASKAALRAGYHQKSGHALLKTPAVAEAIRVAIGERSKRVEITQDMVVRELAAIGFARTTDHTRVSEDGQIQIISSDRWTEDQSRAVSGIKAGRYGVQVSNYDKVKALELIGKHLGMFDGKSASGADQENNLLEVLIEGMEEDIDTDDLPEVE